MPHTITRSPGRPPNNVVAAKMAEAIARNARGESIKEIAFAINRGPSCVRRYMWEAGFRSMLVTHEERKAILAARKCRQSN